MLTLRNLLQIHVLLDMEDVFLRTFVYGCVLPNPFTQDFVNGVARNVEHPPGRFASLAGASQPPASAGACPCPEDPPLRSSEAPSAAARQRRTHVIEVLKRHADIAEAVLTASFANRSLTRRTLTQLYKELPPDLHAAAARGFFGANATEWQLDLGDAAAERASERTVELLPQQPRVTALRLSGAMAGQSQMLSRLPYATQLEEISICGPHKRVRCTAALLRAAAQCGLRSLQVSDCKLTGQSLVQLLPALTQLCELTSLLLDGCIGTPTPAGEAGMAAFANKLSALTELAALRLPSIWIGRVGAEALWAALTGLPRLRTLDLRCTDVMEHCDGVALGAAACTALVRLDLLCCRLDTRIGCVRALCYMQARLKFLRLGQNIRVGCAGASSMLAARALCGLTLLCLSNTGLTPPVQGAEPAWPWRRLCALTDLRDLRLCTNNFGDVGAAALALCIGALKQLTALGIRGCGITAAGALGQEVFALPRLRLLACTQSDDIVCPFVVPAAAAARGLELVPCLQSILR